jgi:hypothetical protein
LSSTTPDPFDFSGQEYCAIIEKRLTGQKVPFPWEASHDTSISKVDPSRDPKTRPVLVAAQQAVVARITGRAKLLRAMQHMLQSKSVETPRPTADSPMTAAFDQVFSDDMSDLF